MFSLANLCIRNGNYLFVDEADEFLGMTVKPPEHLPSIMSKAKQIFPDEFHEVNTITDDPDRKFTAFHFCEYGRYSINVSLYCKFHVDLEGATKFNHLGQTYQRTRRC